MNRTLYTLLFHLGLPLVGDIIMALAVVACMGSLLGWQFTLAQTAKQVQPTP